MNTVYLTTDSDEVLTFVLNDKQLELLYTLREEDLLREDICIKANTKEILIYDIEMKER